jgi:gas vesicle protein
MSDLNHYPNDNPASLDPDPEGDYKEYSGPTQADETPKTESDASSRFGAEILTILEGFGEDIKRLSKSVSEYIDKESFGKAAESVRDALSDAGEGIKRTTQNMGEKLEEERVQRAIKDLKDYAKRTGKSIQDLFTEDVPAHVEDLGEKVAKAAEDTEESLDYESNDPAENDMNFENTFGG